MYQSARTREKMREERENNWKNKENKEKIDVLSKVSIFIPVPGFGVLQIIYIEITQPIWYFTGRIYRSRGDITERKGLSGRGVSQSVA